MGTMINLELDDDGYDPFGHIKDEFGELSSREPDIADASSDAAPADEDPLSNVVKLNASSPEPKTRKPHAIISDYVPTVEQLEDREARAWKEGPRVKGVPILCATTNLIYGPPGSGKSWFVLGVAVEQMAKGNNVIFCDLEFGDEGTIDRMYALGLTYEQQMEHLTVVTGFGDLIIRDMSKIDQMISVMLALIEEKQPSVVIFDTVPALFGWLAEGNVSENDNTAMQKLFNAFFEVSQKAGVPVLATGHTGKQGETMRGASSSHGAARVSYLVKLLKPFGIDTDGVLELVKMKDNNSLVNFQVFVDVVAEGLPKHNTVLPDGTAKIPAKEVKWRTAIEGYVSDETLRDVELAAFVLKQGGPVTATTIKNSSGVKGVAGIIRHRGKNPDAYEKVFEKLASIEGVTGGLDGPWEFEDASASIEDKIEAIAEAFGVDVQVVQTKWNREFD